MSKEKSSRFRLLFILRFKEGFRKFQTTSSPCSNIFSNKMIFIKKYLKKKEQPKLLFFFSVIKVS
jgi:hypothetical protein